MENCKSVCGMLTMQFGIDNKLMTVSLECSRIEEARKYSNLFELSLQLATTLRAGDRGAIL